MLAPSVCPRAYRYEILNYQLMPNGTYAYVQIGEWNNGTLTLSNWPQARTPAGLVESVCSKPCKPGYYKVSVIGIYSGVSELYTVQASN